MKKILVVALLVLGTVAANAQETSKNVSIIVTGSGNTQDDAKQSALRSAIEQAYGAFISSKTEVLNDNLVSDQITSIANGNIQSFEILNEAQLPDGSWGNTLKAVVSIDKLASFVQAKGISVEIQGGLFALNIKQQALNESAEINAINQLVGMMHEVMQTAIDFKIITSSPVSKDATNKNFEIGIKVGAFANKNLEFCAEYYIKTLEGLSLSNSEASNYLSLKKIIYPVRIKYKNKESTFLFRKEISSVLISTLFDNFEFYSTSFLAYRDKDEILEDTKKIRYVSWEKKAGNFDSDMPEDRKWVLSNYYDDYDYYYPSFNFFSNQDYIAEITWTDQLTIEQIGKLNGYTVSPRGLVSRFKDGGIVVHEENGHGFTISMVSFGKVKDIENQAHRWDGSYGGIDYLTAKKFVENLDLCGYKNFRLPTKNEFELIAENIISKGLCSFLTVENYMDRGSIYKQPCFFIKNKKTEAYILTKVGFTYEKESLLGQAKQKLSHIRVTSSTTESYILAVRDF